MALTRPPYVQVTNLRTKLDIRDKME